MGMMLRRHIRPADYAPTVNGKPVAKEPKKKSLTQKPSQNNNSSYASYHK